MATAALVLSPLTAFGAEGPSDQGGESTGQSAVGGSTSVPPGEDASATTDPTDADSDTGVGGTAQSGTDSSPDEIPADGEGDTDGGGDPSARDGSPVESTAGVLQAVDPVTVNLLGITDFHGHFVELSASGAVTTRVAEKLTCAFEDKSAGYDVTLRLSSGDNIGATPFSSAIQDDDPTISILNAMKINVSAVGNHEFDQGWDVLRTRIAGGARTPEQVGSGLAANYVAPTFPYLGANLTGTDLDSYEVIADPASGLRIGVIGTVTQELPSLVTPSGIVGIVGIVGIGVGDPVAVTNEIAHQLKDDDPDNGEADIVVAVMHEDAAKTRAGFDASVVDAVFGGHSHLPFSSVEGQDPAPDEVPAVQADHYGSRLGQIVLTWDPAAGEVLTSETVVADHDVTAYSETCDSAALPGIRAIVDQAVARGNELGNVPAAQLGGTFYRGRAALEQGAEPGEARGVESTLGNLIATSVREGLEERLGTPMDIGVMNAGGIRADLVPDADGWVTKSQMFTVQPFGNTIDHTTMTGAQFKLLLEQQWQPDGSEGQPPSRPLLKLGLSDNVTYTFDASRPTGERILAVTVDGEPLDPARQYVVAANEFLTAGGDNFAAFTLNTVTKTGIPDLELFTEYLTGAGNGVQPSDLPDGAIGIDNSQELPGTGVAAFGLAASGAGGFAAGGTYSLDLSSLSLTEEDRRASSVSVCAVDAGGNSSVLTTSPVDNDYIVDGVAVALQDRFGVASLDFTVPADLEAGSSLTVCDVEGNVLPAGINIGSIESPAGPTPTPTPTPDGTKAPDPSGSPAAAGGSGKLARTGMEGGLFPAAVLVLLAGASLAALNRRLRRD